VRFNIYFRVIKSRRMKWLEHVERMGKVKVKLSPCFFLIEHHAMKACWVSGGISPRVLDIGTIWTSVVSFTPRPLYP